MLVAKGENTVAIFEECTAQQEREYINKVQFGAQ